jgi:hypothetical protein
MPKNRNKELLARHQAARAKVKVCVDDADPVGLLALGAPEDEYDDIVGYLVSKVIRNDEITVTSVEAWIQDRYGVEPSVSTLVEMIASMQTHLHWDTPTTRRQDHYGDS